MNSKDKSGDLRNLERAMGFEPTTASLEGWNSTTELRPLGQLLLQSSSLKCVTIPVLFYMSC